MPEEPMSPDPQNCPSLYENEYHNTIIRYRSNVILEALVNYRLQAEPLPLPKSQGLNSMIRLNGRSSYLSSQNYDAYVSSASCSIQMMWMGILRFCIVVKNRCCNHPYLKKPPWSPFLSASISEEWPASSSVPRVSSARKTLSLDAVF